MIKWSFFCYEFSSHQIQQLMKQGYQLLLLLTFLFFNLTAQKFDNQSYRITWLVKNNKFTLIDVRTKHVIIPPTYDEAHLYSDNISVVKLGKKYGFVNSSGEKLTEVVYDKTWNYNKNLILVQHNDKYKFLDKEGLLDGNLGFAGEIDGDEVEYDQVIFSHVDDYGIVMLADKYGYINQEGKEVIPLVFESATFFEDNFATVRLDGKWGVIDRNGNRLVDFKYNYLGTFNNGTVIAKKRKKWGTIDHTGKTILPFKYKYLTHFNVSDIALAKKGKKWGVINSKGDVIAPFKYGFDIEFETLFDLCDEYVWIQQDDKWGTLDLNGKVVIPFEYDQIHTFDGEETRIWKDGQLMLIDMQGNCLENCKEETLAGSNN